MTRDELVETMAAAIYKSDNFVFGSPAFDRLDAGIQQAYARAATNALSAAEAHGWVMEKGWQPIETAPRDGTHILVGTFPYASGHITTATAHWFDSDAGWALSVNYDGEHSGWGVESPTHWRPLPTPPQEDTDGR